MFNFAPLTYHIEYPRNPYGLGECQVALSMVDYMMHCSSEIVRPS
jgi:hypothetical protein